MFYIVKMRRTMWHIVDCEGFIVGKPYRTKRDAYNALHFALRAAIRLNDTCDIV